MRINLSLTFRCQGGRSLGNWHVSYMLGTGSAVWCEEVTGGVGGRDMPDPDSYLLLCQWHVSCSVYSRGPQASLALG